MNDEELLLRLRTPLMGGRWPAVIRTTWSMGPAESGDSCLLYTRLKDGYGRLRWNLLFQLPPLALCRFCNLMVQWKFLFIKRYICITIPNENLDTLIGKQVTSSKP
jgi:hypothetical protein